MFPNSDLRKPEKHTLPSPAEYGIYAPGAFVITILPLDYDFDLEEIRQLIVPGSEGSIKYWFDTRKKYARENVWVLIWVPTRAKAVGDSSKLTPGQFVAKAVRTVLGNERGAGDSIILTEGELDRLLGSFGPSSGIES